LQTKINPRESGGKKNANWVVSLSLKAFTYSFAKVEIDLKD